MDDYHLFKDRIIKVARFDASSAETRMGKHEHLCLNNSDRWDKTKKYIFTSLSAADYFMLLFLYNQLQCIYPDNCPAAQLNWSNSEAVLLDKLDSIRVQSSQI